MLVPDTAGGSSQVAARRTVGGLAVGLGGLKLVAASFLPWVRADVRGQGIVLGSGWNNIAGEIGHGPLVAGIGTVLAVTGALAVVGIFIRQGQFAVLFSILAAGVVVYQIIDIATPASDIETSWAVGTYLMVVGVAVAFVGSLLCLGAGDERGESVWSPPPVPLPLPENRPANPGWPESQPPVIT
ncbi:MAG TPA: hypothetical protein VJM33_04225 [Microthrixaceae bacterium]|nr:hypothetical protein [Microthrixaceae bacterium]